MSNYAGMASVIQHLQCPALYDLSFMTDFV